MEDIKEIMEFMDSYEEIMNIIKEVSEKIGDKNE